MKREKLDPCWHKSRIAARIWLKAQRGRKLTAREKRLAKQFGEDRGVEDRLIQQEILGLFGGPYRSVQTRSGSKQVLHTIGEEEFADVLDAGN